jgi:hypothetical protein
MNMWAAAAGFMVVMTCVGLGLRLSFQGIYVARSKGYRHMGLAGTLGYFLLCALFGWSAFVLPQFRELAAQMGASYMVAAGIVVCLVSGAGVRVLAVLIPRRTFRTAVTSKAHVPFALLGGFVLVITTIAAAIGWFATNSLQPLLLISIGIPAGLGLLGLGRRSRAPTARDLLEVDHRPPVLYLRAFSREADVFAKAAYRSNAERKYRNAEQYLGHEIHRALGPFLAFGSPLDYMPPEEGVAARVYAADDKWQKEFMELASAAQILLVAPHYSQNLAFELWQARQSRWIHKVRVLTSPQLQLTKVERFSWRVGVWIGGRVIGQRIAPHDWEGFRRVVADAGFAPECVGEVPSAGSALALSPDGSLRLIREGMTTPREFVAALAEPVESTPEPQAEAPSDVTAASFSGRLDSREGRTSIYAYIAALAFAGLSLGLLAKNVRGTVEEVENARRVPETILALNAGRAPEQWALTILHGRPVYAGTRIITRPGAGVFEPGNTGSVPVIIGKGQTGTVKGVPESGLILVSWDPQLWEEHTWASSWGIPGFYTKRYVKLERFAATINGDWIEVARPRD